MSCLFPFSFLGKAKQWFYANKEVVLAWGNAPMHLSPGSFRCAKPMPSRIRSQAFNSSRMKPLSRCATVYKIISLHAHTMEWRSRSSSKDFIMGSFIQLGNRLMLLLEVHSLISVLRKFGHLLKRWLLDRFGLMNERNPAPARFTSLKRSLCSQPRLIFS
jgi:hypothetical protein